MAEKFLAKSKAQDAARQNGQAPAAEPQPLAGRFWRFAVIFSFVVNLILLVVVVALVAMLFQITNGLASPIVGGLHDSFLEMQSASIVTTIPVNETIVVNDTIPVVFDLPLNQNTTVVTTEPLTINGATVNIQSGGLTLNANADIVLPAGTSLPVQLNLVVPVSQTVPVSLKVPVQITVPVNIPLAQTELNAPFSQLASIVAPYDTMLKSLPTSWSEALLGK
ncbi:MAG: hypothetical protein JNK29_03795 [Anaerolineales bacterium]|nr:hypothetical protein [Anaerolineales bacterium]